VVRSEDLRLGVAGPALAVQAKLFMGSATEYRLALGLSVLRAVGPSREELRPGASVRVTFQTVRLYRFHDR
jgi:hypothetical protein